MIIFRKDYSAEELCDVERDVIEAFDPRFNDIINDLPMNKDGFIEGNFTVTIQWKED